jgi:molybdenum cofactor cytidylyltransferase
VKPVAAVILAAGFASRMAPRNKLLILDKAGVEMVAAAAAAALASGADPVILVTGHQADLVRAAVAGLSVRTVFAERFAAGMSASLQAGIAAVPPACQAALICLADMGVDGALMARILAAYEPLAGRRIIVPTCGGQRGNPVLWDRRFFADFAALTGDAGARRLLDRHAADVWAFETGDPAVLADWDTPEDLASGF